MLKLHANLSLNHFFEMMFLGNTEALAVSSEQLKRMNEMRTNYCNDVYEFSFRSNWARANDTWRTCIDGNSTKYY